LKDRIPLALLVADVESDLIDVTFYYSDTGHMHVRIEAEDRIGTLEVITSAFSGFNILQAYHRTIEKRNSSKTDLFLHLERDYLPDRDLDHEIDNRIKETASMQSIKARRIPLKLLTPADRKRKDDDSHQQSTG